MMRKVSILLLVVLLALGAAVPAAAFTDIEGSWAREAITRLNHQGLFDGIFDGTYQPNANISREDLIEIAARGFDLSVADKQQLYTWLDHLVPMQEDAEYNGDMLTRAELVALVANVLNITEDVQVDDVYPSFDDVDPDHPAFLPIELVHRLGILPTYVLNRFEPERLSTRAEVATMLDAAMNLQTLHGQVAELQESISRLIVQTSNGVERSVPIVANTLILRNNASARLGDLRPGEHVSVVYDQHGQAQIVSANGSGTTVTLFDGIGQLGDLVQNLEGIITPQQLAALLTGDWSGVSDGFRHNLYYQLVDVGLAPWEAEALLSQDWNALQAMGKDRIAYAASDYSGVSPELVYSALDGNWTRAMEYAQVEIAQRLMTSWWGTQ